MISSGITHMGRNCEIFVKYLLKNKIEECNNRIGDFIYNDMPIEVKKNTLNQVRPRKHCSIILIGIDDYNKIEFDSMINKNNFSKAKTLIDGVYIMSPLTVIQLAATKKGQHGQNPFDCCNFGKYIAPSLQEYKINISKIYNEICRCYKEYKSKKYTTKKKELEQYYYWNNKKLNATKKIILNA